MTSPSTVLLRTQSDERLVALARAGHDRAFEAIVERYRRPLLRACRRILPEARAEDALQQALVAAWRGLQRGDDVQELRPWLYRIVRNTALNQLRVAGYDLGELVETLSAHDDPEEEVLRKAVVRQTLAAVAALPERQREALLRTAIGGHGQEDVARDLGLSNTAVRQLVHRARVAVRAAATAVVPMPLATWLAAGAGSAGAAATVAKAGTLVVLAGGVAAAPVLIEEERAQPRQRTEARAQPEKVHEASAVGTAPVVAPAVTRSRPVTTRVHAESSGDRGESEHESDDRSGHTDDRSGRGGGDDDSNSGPGGGGHDDAEEVEDHSDSGPGGGDDDVETPVATATPVPTVETVEEDHSGKGRGGGGETEDSSGPGSGPDEPHDD